MVRKNMVRGVEENGEIKPQKPKGWTFSNKQAAS